MNSDDEKKTRVKSEMLKWRLMMKLKRRVISEERVMRRGREKSELSSEE